MKRYLIAFSLLSIFQHSISTFAEDEKKGPVYNFHFYNGEQTEITDQNTDEQKVDDPDFWGETPKKVDLLSNQQSGPDDQKLFGDEEKKIQEDSLLNKNPPGSSNPLPPPTASPPLSQTRSRSLLEQEKYWTITAGYFQQYLTEGNGTHLHGLNFSLGIPLSNFISLIPQLIVIERDQRSQGGGFKLDLNYNQALTENFGFNTGVSIFGYSVEKTCGIFNRGSFGCSDSYSQSLSDSFYPYNGDYDKTNSTITGAEIYIGPYINSGALYSSLDFRLGRATEKIEALSYLNEFNHLSMAVGLNIGLRL